MGKSTSKLYKIDVQLDSYVDQEEADNILK